MSAYDNIFNVVRTIQGAPHTGDVLAGVDANDARRLQVRQQAEIERGNLAREGHNTAVLGEQTRAAHASEKAARMTVLQETYQKASALEQMGRHTDALSLLDSVEAPPAPGSTPRIMALPQNINAMQQPPAPMEQAPAEAPQQSLPKPVGGFDMEFSPEEATAAMSASPLNKPYDPNPAGEADRVAAEADKALTAGITGLTPKPQEAAPAAPKALPRSIDDLMLGGAPPSLKIGEIVGDEASARADTGIADPMAETPEMARARDENQYDPATAVAPRWEGGAGEDRSPADASTLTKTAREVAASVGMPPEEADKLQEFAVSLEAAGARAGESLVKQQDKIVAFATRWRAQESRDTSSEWAHDDRGAALAAKAKGKGGGGGGSFSGLGKKDSADAKWMVTSQKGINDVVMVRRNEQEAGAALADLRANPSIFGDRVALSSLLHKYFGGAQTQTERDTLLNTGGWSTKLEQMWNNVESGAVTDEVKAGILADLEAAVRNSGGARAKGEANIRTAVAAWPWANKEVASRAVFGSFGMSHEGEAAPGNGGPAPAAAAVPLGAPSATSTADPSKHGGKWLQ